MDVKRAMIHCKSSLDQGQYLTTYYCRIPYSTESCDLYIMYYHKDFRKKGLLDHVQTLK